MIGLMDDQTMFDLFDSLKREFESFKREIKQDFKQEIQPLKDAIARMDSRLSRHGGIIQGGSRQVSRLISWSEDTDELLAARDRRIEELERRVSKLEGQPPA